MTATRPDDELERLLRATFAGRAHTVTHGVELDDVPTRRRTNLRQHAWWAAPIAAAAAVLIAVAAMVAGGGTKHHTVVPGTGHPAPSVTPTTPPLSACRVALPARWRQALATPDNLPVQPSGYSFLSVETSGAVLAFQDLGPVPDSPRRVVEIQPGGSVHTLYTVPDPNQYDVYSAYRWQHWLVLGIHDNPRHPRGEVGGNSAEGLHSVVVVDLNNGSTHTLVTTVRSGKGTAVNNVVELGGQVYWDQRATYAARRGVVKDYDLATGRTRTVSQSTGWPELDGGAMVSLNDGADVIAQLPPPRAVADAMTADGGTHAVTDGSSWAWVVSRDELGWWQPGAAAPQYLHTVGRISTQAGANELVVAGHYALVAEFVKPQQAYTVLVDLRTGAAAVLQAAYGPLRLVDFSASAASAFVGYAETKGDGHWVEGYWQDPRLEVARLDTDGLPDLRC